MAAPILTTKLYLPPPRAEVIPRPHLIEQLNEGLSRKLTLISAPAGFGKTTLVSEWVAACARPTAWLSLDEGDGDLTRFLTYLVAALQAIDVADEGAAGDGEIGAEVLGMLHAPQPAATEAILTTLLNEIAAIPNDFALVLDDYHVIEAHAVDQALAFLLEHLPRQMHLVITTREDPQFPLARLRARRQLTEVRATDLRFSLAETAGFLNQVMGLTLTPAEIAALETRTEGWIAGLQLAALSMQGQADVAGFIEAFAGDHRYIVDYLVEEVLLRQPEAVRDFLLHTAILNRLSGPLCDAVTAQAGGTGRLEALERGNLFVVPLDNKRQWYRYHHLFADVLYAHLIAEQPAHVPTLHQRASAWYERNGALADAVRHALAAEDYARAAGLVELAWPAMDGSYQTATWLGWVKALPDELLHARPVLCVAYAWAFLNGGELEAADVRLRDAEQWLDASTGLIAYPEAQAAEAQTSADESSAMRGPKMIVVDKEQLRTLPASIASARAYLTQASGDFSGSILYGQRALDFLPAEEYHRRGVAGALLGLAYWTNGDLDAAERIFAEGLANLRRTGNLLFALRGTYSLADIRLAQGHLRAAIQTYEEALQLAAAQDEQVLRGTADLCVRLSELYREQGNEEAATAHLRKGEELGKHDASAYWPYRLALAQARIKQAQGDLDGALEYLDEAERQYVRSPVPEMHPITALRARVWISQGKLADAQRWIDAQGLAVDDELNYLREFEYMTLARIRIAHYQHHRDEDALAEAMALLARLLHAAEAGARMGSVLDILIQQALAHEAQGNLTAAHAPLARALTLAEPEGYVRLFVDEGAPMARLLSAAAKQGLMPHYTDKLLAVFSPEASPQSSSSPPPLIPSVQQPLVEPLSERELEVLQLVAQGLSNREISERLYLALSSVKGHNRNIFGKLQVQRRTEAVARARALNLL